jgi:sialate O-acetylesterase
MKKWAQFTLLISGFCFWAVLPSGVAAFTDPIDESQYTGLIRVACCGDSITYGTGISDRATNSYPAQLQSLLGANYDVRNFGRSGARVTQSSSNPYKGSAEYNAAIAFNPHVVIICLGINDCSVSQWPGNKPHFVNDYQDLISDFKALTPTPPVKIWLGTLMPVVPPYEPYIGIQGTIAECDPLIEQVATDEGLTLVDLFTRLNMEQNY